MHRLINYCELVKGSWSSVINQCHHLVTDTQRGLSSRINVSSPHLCRVMMCDMLCSSELSHHNLSHNLPSARSTGDKPALVFTLYCPSSSWRAEAKPQNNTNKTNLLPKPVEPTPKATAGSGWILHSSLAASWYAHTSWLGNNAENFILNEKFLDSSETY